MSIKAMTTEQLIRATKELNNRITEFEKLQRSMILKNCNSLTDRLSVSYMLTDLGDFEDMIPEIKDGLIDNEVPIELLDSPWLQAAWIQAKLDAHPKKLEQDRTNQINRLKVELKRLENKET